MRKVCAETVFAQEKGRKALFAQQQRASVQNTSVFMLGRLGEVNSTLSTRGDDQLAIPKGHLSKLVGVNEMFQPESRIEPAASVPLGGLRRVLSKFRILRFAVQKVRRVRAGLRRMLKS